MNRITDLKIEIETSILVFFFCCISFSGMKAALIYSGECILEQETEPSQQTEHTLALMLNFLPHRPRERNFHPISCYFSRVPQTG